MSVIEPPSYRLGVAQKPVPKVTKSDRTRSAILNAVHEFIWAHPFRDMTVSSLMSSTDISRSAFYQYFEDIHHLMQTLLDMLAEEILGSISPWLEGVGDPVVLMNETLAGLIRTCYRRGPLLRAVADAATTDERFEKSWRGFLDLYDDACCARIEADQAQGLIADFDARPVTFALNRLNAYSIIEGFGRRPRSKPEPVREALARIWISTLYGAQWVEKGSSNLVRK